MFSMGDRKKMTAVFCFLFSLVFCFFHILIRFKGIL